METKNKSLEIALITGASKGIGRAAAVELARAGYYIVINYLSDLEGAKKTLSMVRDSGSDGEIAQFDVRDQEVARSAVEDVASKFQKIDVLINNAGIIADGLFLMMEPDRWQPVIDTSLNGFYNLTRPVLEFMIRRKKGSIVSLSSASAIMPNRGQANYSAAKAGLTAASRVVASEVARFGIRVNVVAPGLIDTEMIKQAPVDIIKSLIPMARVGRPEEVAKVIRFLCSDDASYITGQVISVNGGMC